MWSHANLGEVAVIEQILHDQQVHLCDLRLATALVLLRLPESDLVAAEDFRQQSRSLFAPLAELATGKTLTTYFRDDSRRHVVEVCWRKCLHGLKLGPRELLGNEPII